MRKKRKYKKELSPVRVDRLAEVGRLDRMGFSQKEIAQRLKVSQPMICKDLQLVKEKYKEQTVVHHSAHVEEKLLQFRQLRCQLWVAYYKSLKKFRKEEKVYAPQREKKGEDGVPPINMPPNRKKYKGAKADVVEKYIRQFDVIRKTKTIETRIGNTMILAQIEKVLCDECDLLGLWAPKRVEAVHSTVSDVWAPLSVPTPATDQIDDIIAKLQSALPSQTPTITQEVLPPEDGDESSKNGNGRHP